jgi:hypothetical protein
VVQLTTTKGPSARRLHRWIWRARTFSRPALAGQQDGRFAGGGLARGLEQTAHRETPRIEQGTLLESIAQDPVFGAQALHLERALDRVSDLVERKGLGYIVERTGLHRGDRTLDRGVGSHQDDGGAGELAL